VRLTAQQEDVVSVGQLRQLGFTEDEIRGRVLRGEWVRVHRGVLLVGRRLPSPHGALRAALFAAGPLAFLSHLTAVAVYRMRRINRRAIELTRPGAPRKLPGLIVHRSATVDPRDVRTYRDMRVSTFPRMLIELARRETPTELWRLITEGVRRNLLDLKKMEETLARHPRRPGLQKLTPLLDRYIDPTDRKSGLERAFAAYAPTDPRIPPYTPNIHIDRWEIDCWWPELQVALELDGRPYHRALADTDRDNAKNRWLQAHGILFCRITDFEWDYNREEAIDDLIAIIDLRRRAAA
jgi:hypothetical protein